MDMAAMLRELGDAGWAPVLYAETDRDRVVAWVCYPQAAVRYWTSARASDPAIAVRALYLHAKEHPNEPPRNALLPPEALRKDPPRPAEVQPWPYAYRSPAPAVVTPGATLHVKQDASPATRHALQQLAAAAWRALNPARAWSAR